MEDRVKELMDRIRGTASAAADACADTARVAGRKAGQIVDVAKLNVQLFDLNGELNDVLRQLGQVMYDAHRGQAGGDESIPDLLARADELNEKIGGMKDQVSALRQSRTCGNCGAVCGREDKFCRSCGQPLE